MGEPAVVSELVVEGLVDWSRVAEIPVLPAAIVVAFKNGS
jgi:hypothetical protein